MAYKILFFFRLEGVKLKELGQYLRETRISNGVGLEEAANDLNMDVDVIENIEEGNVKAFKDILALRKKMKEYAKYLGLDSDNVADEFNDFLFEHTSKISLQDILDAEKRREEEGKKIESPYTIIKTRSINYKPIIWWIIFCLFLILLIVVFKRITNPKLPVRNIELLDKNIEEVIL